MLESEAKKLEQELREIGKQKVNTFRSASNNSWGVQYLSEITGNWVDFTSAESCYAFLFVRYKNESTSKAVKS